MKTARYTISNSADRCNIESCCSTLSGVCNYYLSLLQGSSWTHNHSQAALHGPTHRNISPCPLSEVGPHSIHLLSWHPCGLAISSVCLAPKAHFEGDVLAGDLPGVALSQPDVRDLSLVAVLDDLLEHTIPDSSNGGAGGDEGQRATR